MSIKNSCIYCVHSTGGYELGPYGLKCDRFGVRPRFGCVCSGFEFNVSLWESRQSVYENYLVRNEEVSRLRRLQLAADLKQDAINTWVYFVAYAYLHSGRLLFLAPVPLYVQGDLFGVSALNGGL